MMGLEPLSEEEEARVSAVPSPMRTQQEGGRLQVCRGTLTRNQIDQHLDLGLPSLQNCETLSSVLQDARSMAFHCSIPSRLRQQILDLKT